jgi:hypothetical protein
MTCERARSIYIIVVRQECDISVGHLYKWSLRVVKRCVFSAALLGCANYGDRIACKKIVLSFVNVCKLYNCKKVSKVSLLVLLSINFINAIQ